MEPYTVKVKDYDGKNKFEVNGLRQRVIDAAAEETIIFDQSDASNAGHRLRIALYPDGAHLGPFASEYTAGVTVEGTPGHVGAKTKFTPPNLNFEAYINLNLELLDYYNAGNVWNYGDGDVAANTKSKAKFGESHWYGAGVGEPSRTPPPEKDLHGTYFYYCENHRFMGGMIHYGSNSIPENETVPAKYRLVDEGATASDAQDGDLTIDIAKTIEQYNELTEEWDHTATVSNNHSNPWAVRNTDTRNSVRYRIRYEVQDSVGVAAYSRNKLIDIASGDPSLVDLAPGQIAYLDGQVFSVGWQGVTSGQTHHTFLALHPSRWGSSPQYAGFGGTTVLAGWYNAELDEFNISDYQYNPFTFGCFFCPRGLTSPQLSLGPAVTGGIYNFFSSRSFIWASSNGFQTNTSELTNFNIKASKPAGDYPWTYNPKNPAGPQNYYSGDYTVNGLDKPFGYREELMHHLTWQRTNGTDFAGNGLPKIKINPGVYAPNLLNFTPPTLDFTSSSSTARWTLSNGYLETLPINPTAVQPYFAGGGASFPQ